MKAPQRFEDAIQKLYTAFYSQTLNPECCKQCAVGNIMNNTESWKHFSDDHGSLRLNYVGLVHQEFGRKFSGYTPLELLQIEAAFLKGCGYELPFRHSSRKPENPKDREVLFNGLCAAIELLCNMDGVENVMDYSQLFAHETPQQKNPLLV
ncbi:Na(+)-translocating NADH-quinone reductase subunit F [Aureisphaera galaxeae]|uniref:Na(+)-translocating NADH-quinone reductase subunit F n=1 Tax=Aureisphaera galaxeae TaxID=1538023 RepID=UPI00234FE943|nr:Na(+)-translocating NADH-quinone reductase subunit F [Aureisphaera galaxeae]MDC8005649.1 Na(+)-translocating NADH-quinone reductase subunit F [Aureisphaera galaxeae]